MVDHCLEENCGKIVKEESRFEFQSSNGPVLFRKVFCEVGHWYIEELDAVEFG